MKTGLIINISGNQATVMKNNGEFILVPVEKGWQKGDIISLAPAKAPKNRSLQALAASIALIFLIGTGSFRLLLTQASLISIDVNPSIELKLNRLNRVITAVAKNPEGARILENKNLWGQTYGNALENILNQENMNAYLSREATVVVTVFSSSQSRQEQLKISIESATEKALAAHHSSITAETEILAVDGSTIKEAHDCGMTAGKYLYLEQLKELAPDIDMEQYMHHSIGQIKSEISHCQSEHSEQRRQEQHRHGHGRH